MRSRALLHLLGLVLNDWHMLAWSCWVESNTLCVESVLEGDHAPFSVGKNVPHCKLLTFVLVQLVVDRLQ